MFLNICVFNIEMTEIGDKLLSLRERVSKEDIEHTRSLARIRRSYRNKSASRRRHRGFDIISASFSPSPFERWRIYFLSPI